MPSANALESGATRLKPSHEPPSKAIVLRFANISRQDARPAVRGCPAWILSMDAAFLQEVQSEVSLLGNRVEKPAKNDEDGTCLCDKRCSRLCTFGSSP